MIAPGQASQHESQKMPGCEGHASQGFRKRKVGESKQKKNGDDRGQKDIKANGFSKQGAGETD